MTRFRWLRRYFIVLVVFLGWLGCGEKGPPLGSVRGTISLEGDPVEGAYVDFSPLFQGGSEVRAAQKTDSSGYYEMQYSVERNGVMIGKHQVQVSTKDWEKQPDGSNKVIPERIPRYYIGPDSILEFDVKEGENTADFDLSKEKPN